MTYRVRLSGPAQRSLQQLPTKALDAVLAFISGPLSEHPTRVGKPLRNELKGLHSARVGPYRVLYRIDDQIEVVMVIRVAHRGDVYR